MARHTRLIFVIALVLAGLLSTYSFMIKISISPIHADFIVVTGNGTVLIDTVDKSLVLETPLFLYCNGTVQLTSREPMNVTFIGAVGNIRLLNGTLCINGTCVKIVRIFENYTLRIGTLMLFLSKSRIFEWYGTRLVLNMTFIPETPSSFPVLEIVSKSPVEVICNVSR